MVSIATVVATIKADVTHCARDWPRLKWWLIAGMATLNMVDEMNEAIVPTMTAKRKYQRKRSPYSAFKSVEVCWLIGMRCCRGIGVHE